MQEFLKNLSMKLFEKSYYEKESFDNALRIIDRITDEDIFLKYIVSITIP